MKIQTLKTRKVAWVDVAFPSQSDIPALEKRFKLHPYTVREFSSASQRTKIEAHDDTIFITQLYPYYDRKIFRIKQAEINILVEKNRIITFHQNLIPVIADFFSECSNDSAVKRHSFGSVDHLFYEILSRHLDYTHPMLDHFAKDLNDIETRLMQGHDKDSLEDIMVLRRNITDFRRIMQGHKNMMRRYKMVADSVPAIHSDEQSVLINDLVAHTREIWDRLDAYKEAVETLHQTNESLITFKMNSVMKMVAIFTALMLPITAITGLFGMNTIPAQILGTEMDFLIVCGMCLFSVLVVILVFLWKKWL